MNRTIAQKFIDCIQAFADGETIQAKVAGCDESKWGDCDNPSWSPDYDYRIKPETKYRSFKDCDELVAGAEVINPDVNPLLNRCTSLEHSLVIRYY